MKSRKVAKSWKKWEKVGPCPLDSARSETAHRPPPLRTIASVATIDAVVAQISASTSVWFPVVNLTVLMTGEET